MCVPVAVKLTVQVISDVRATPGNQSCAHRPVSTMHVLEYPRFRIGQEFIPDDLDAAVRWGDCDPATLD